MRLSTSSIVLAALAGAGSAIAQTPGLTATGTVADVQGLVTMSFGSEVATVQPQTPLFDGARLVAGSSGSAQVRLQNGCVFSLKANQAVVVDSRRTCDEQIAAILTLPDEGAGAVFAGRGGVVLPLLVGAALVGAVANAKEGQISPTPK
jgi:hypothetical protein